MPDVGNVIKKVYSSASDVEECITSVKKEFSRVFSKEMSAIKGFKASVVLREGVTPIFCKAYAVPYALAPKVEKEILRLEETGVICRVLTSRWASPIVAVAKRDGNIRICVDLKTTLNRAIDMQHYRLPTVEEILASMGGGKIFCVLDLAGAFQQIEIAEECQELFVINTQFGLFRYVRLPQGLKTAPCIFQSVIDNILRGLNAKCYVDDLVVKGTNFTECVSNLRAVLERLAEYNVRANVNKCQFFKESVEYLGHIISEKGIEPSPCNVEAIIKAPVPSTVTQLKSYLGMINYYRKFVHMQSSMLAPFYRLTKKI